MTTRQNKPTNKTRKQAAAITGKGAELKDNPKITIDASVLSEAVMLNLTLHRWTNRAKTDKVNGRSAQITLTGAQQPKRNKSDIAADRLRTTMKMINSPALDAVNARLSATKQWLFERCMPSYMVQGVRLVKIEAVEIFEDAIEDCRTWLRTEGIPALIADYPRAMQQAEEDFARIAEEMGIESPFDVKRYPSTDEFFQRFEIEHNWVSFGVPQNLPQAIREQEQMKIQARFEEAADEIGRALREGFADVLAKATDRLTAAPGKKMIIKDAFLENFIDFCETFRFRNLTNDDELSALVDQAKSVMSGITRQDLTVRPSLRRNILTQLGAIRETVDSMIEEAPARRFDLGYDEDEE
jgi:hypothetical protein